MNQVMIQRWRAHQAARAEYELAQATEAVAFWARVRRQAMAELAGPVLRWAHEAKAA